MADATHASRDISAALHYLHGHSTANGFWSVPYATAPDGSTKTVETTDAQLRAIDSHFHRHPDDTVSLVQPFDIQAWGEGILIARAEAWLSTDRQGDTWVFTLEDTPQADKRQFSASRKAMIELGSNIVFDGEDTGWVTNQTFNSDAWKARYARSLDARSGDAAPFVSAPTTDRHVQPRNPITLRVVGIDEIRTHPELLALAVYVGRNAQLNIRNMTELGNPHRVSDYDGDSGPAAFAYAHDLSIARGPSALATIPRADILNARIAQLAHLAIAQGTLPIVCHGCVPCHGHALASAVADTIKRAGHDVRIPGAKDRACIELMRRELDKPHADERAAAAAYREEIVAIRKAWQERAERSTPSHTAAIEGCLSPEVSPNPNMDGKDHLNIYSKAKTALGRELSNFAHTPIDLPAGGPERGIYANVTGHFASIEGLWYYLTTPPTHPDRETLRTMHGPEAKTKGREMRGTDRSSDADRDAFVATITSALDVKLRTYPHLLDGLANTRLPLAHYYVFSGRAAQNGNAQDRWVIEHLAQRGQEARARHQQSGHTTAISDPLAPPTSRSQPVHVTVPAEPRTSAAIVEQIRAFVAEVGMRDIAGNATKGIPRDDLAITTCETIGRATARTRHLGISSGRAPGADQAYVRGYRFERPTDAVIEVLPKDGFEGGRADGQSMFVLGPDEQRRAQDIILSNGIHPNPDALRANPHWLRLHARNVAQDYLPTLNEPVFACVAYAIPTNGSRDGGAIVNGGTNTAVVIAHRSKIPLYLVRDQNEMLAFLKDMDAIERGKRIVPTGPPLRMTAEVGLNLAPHGVYLFARNASLDDLCSHLKRREIRYVLDTSGQRFDRDVAESYGLTVVDCSHSLGPMTRAQAAASSPFVAEMDKLATAAQKHRIAVFASDSDPTESHLASTVAFGLAERGVQPLFIGANAQTMILTEVIEQLHQRHDSPYRSSIHESVDALEQRLIDRRAHESAERADRTSQRVLESAAITR